ncbi:unnamed protein product [Adineta steineri]|uniref:Uncharacterized protein n=2 Tax=Adineta steineri TaxID=433720 RepID=A0A818J3C8_9BILA|nr:unnamed protein product [Adineta steineri]CAF3972080.1 unnamed protein product [Adineta steineri]
MQDKILCRSFNGYGEFMTNYTDLPLVTLVQHEGGRYIFQKEKSDEHAQLLTETIINLIKQHGFDNYDSQCIPLLETCLIDFSKDLILCFKQRMESLGSSITMQHAFERILNDVMSIDLHELYSYMKNDVNSM